MRSLFPNLVSRFVGGRFNFISSKLGARALVIASGASCSLIMTFTGQVMYETGRTTHSVESARLDFSLRTGTRSMIGVPLWESVTNQGTQGLYFAESRLSSGAQMPLLRSSTLMAQRM